MSLLLLFPSQAAGEAEIRNSAVPLVSGHVYRLTFRIRSSYAPQTLELLIRNSTGLTNSLNTTFEIPTADTWKIFKFEFTAGASKFIETYCNRKFGRATVSNELLSGRGGKRLNVKRAPIISGETLTLERRVGINDDFDVVSSDVYVVDYNAGALILQGSNSWETGAYSGRFVEGEQNYRVSYVGGFYLPVHANYQDGTDDDLDLPFDLEMACIELVGNAFRKRKSSGIASQKVFQVQRVMVVDIYF